MQVHSLLIKNGKGLNQETDIAHYSRTGACLYALLLLAVFGVIYILPLCTPVRDYLAHKGMYWLAALGFAWVTGIIVVAMEVILITSVLFRGRKAIWIEDGMVVYFHRWFTAIPGHTISTVSWGEISVFGIRGVILQNKNAETTKLPTWMLSESPETIANRLNHVIVAFGQRPCV